MAIWEEGWPEIEDRSDLSAFVCNSDANSLCQAHSAKLSFPRRLAKAEALTMMKFKIEIKKPDQKTQAWIDARKRHRYLTSKYKWRASWG
jgi:hypothetical protein